MEGQSRHPPCVQVRPYSCQRTPRTLQTMYSVIPVSQPAMAVHFAERAEDENEGAGEIQRGSHPN